MARTFRHDDTDDEFLKDRHRGRVPLMMRDAQPHWMSDADRYFGERAAASRVIAGDGLVDGLHRPGFRHDAVGRRADMAYDAKKSAYEEYDRWMQDAWKGDKEGFSETSLGAPCTCNGERYPNDFGSPGHVRRVDGELICVADRNSSAGDRMTVDQAYAEYDAELANAWKTSR